MKKVYYITKKNASKPVEGVELLELLEIVFTPDSKLSQKIKEAECLIFTSKNALFALEHFLPRQWQNLPCYVIGKGSKRALETLEGKAEFVASRAYGDSFGRELAKVLQGKKALFIHAKKVASNLAEILRKKRVWVLESVLYETKILTIPKQERQKIKPNSIVFFSAPSHIRAFLQNYSWKADYLALCIGKSTAKAAQEMLDKEAQIMLSPKVSIKDSLEFAKQLNKGENNGEN